MKTMLEYILLIVFILLLIIFTVCGCDYSAYNSRTYADGSQWTGVGTISVLSIKDRRIRDMCLRDGSRLGEAATKIDPDEEAIRPLLEAVLNELILIRETENE